MPSMPPSPPSSDPLDGLPPEHEGLNRLPPAARAALAAELPDARRKLSPRGLDTWLRGVDALHQMGRGEGVLRAWIAAMPPVARDLGEDVLAETATACLGFASRTSGAVIERILDTAPLAARRLGDPAVYLSYLRFLEHVLSRAPRALRPMLDHLSDLLDVLTLGGLRRWADWGIEAHRTDYPSLDAYFSLTSEASRSVLQAERKGTLLVDVQRRLAMYLRALWGRDFMLVPTAGDFESRAGLRPYVEGFLLHLPDALDDWQGAPGLDLYRAQAAHLAAHLAALQAPILAEGLNALQMQAIGLIEDARAEALAIARFPNLRQLWARFHTETVPGTAGAFDRIARALLTGTAEEDLSRWTLHSFAALNLSNPAEARALGLALAARLRDLPYSPHRDVPSCPYHCDNRVLWEYEEIDWSQSSAAAPAQVRKYVSVLDMVNEVEVETAGDDAQEIWVQAAELFDDDGHSFNAREGKPPVSPPVLYEEFDHTIQMLRPAWATLREVRARAGDPAQADAILAANRKVTDRLRHLLDAMRPQGAIRIRKLEDGDELDLNAAVSAAIDTRLRRQPDPRVMMRVLRKTRDTAVLVLLDLSESTNDPAAGGQTVLSLTQTACLMLADAIHRVGDRFALHGFCSDGRSNVFYSRIKDFDQPWGPAAKARIMGAEGKLSTRMGTALRHATAHLARIKAARKLLLVLTDGAPADIDVRDPFYLRADARAAVDAARRQGVIPFCLTLDPGADAYAQRIFGPRNVQVLDRVDRLPERLPQLYASLTR
ncbi:VWA domain-containing protein [Rhodobacter sp. Har01]|uniref:nitric oxide reductase activation protein NorD n=1 Tax=Rhodobacter sp. Har01 TaxID=2883999 RepID=UPI001D06F009|nr:VWA domain-containing protein [Rhodobacter sp. Har01]MCB6176615.1 VWA domain-containing protein [Rhodobacter sp. Har01]